MPRMSAQKTTLIGFLRLLTFFVMTCHLTSIDWNQNSMQDTIQIYLQIGYPIPRRAGLVVEI